MTEEKKYGEPFQQSAEVGELQDIADDHHEPGLKRNLSSRHLVMVSPLRK